MIPCVEVAGAFDGSKQMTWRPHMTGLKTILAAMALAGILSTGVGDAQRFEKPHSGTSTSEVSNQPMQSARLALVIGSSSYPDADVPLAQTVNDARALAGALRKDGFDVDLVEEATGEEMARAIARLKAKLRPDSTVMVYFGGLGVQSDGESYMIPVDAKIWYENDVRREGVSIDRLLSGLNDSGARIRLAVIDASRRNPYERRFRSYSHGLAPIEAGENALILTSMPPGQVVNDADGSRSLLISALLDEMNSSTASVEQIFNGTRLTVARETQNQQIPAVSSSLIDDVKFGPAPTTAVVSSGRYSSVDRRT
jgi:uncharacterized caspase-like protein